MTWRELLHILRNIPKEEKKKKFIKQMIVDTTKREAIMLNYTMKTDAWKQIRPKEKLASTNSYSFILKKN